MKRDILEEIFEYEAVDLERRTGMLFDTDTLLDDMASDRPIPHEQLYNLCRDRGNPPMLFDTKIIYQRRGCRDVDIEFEGTTYNKILKMKEIIAKLTQPLPQLKHKDVIDYEQKKLM